MLGSRDDASPAPGDEAACHVAELGTCLQITVGGEIDLAAAPLLRDAAARAAFGPGRLVVLDLSSVSFVDSSVAHFAVDLDRRAATHGGELVVIAGAQTKTLFELVGAGDLRIVEQAADRNGGPPAA